MGATSAMAASHPHSRTAIRNATPACGSYCQDFSSRLLGPRTIANAYVSGDTGAVPGHPGQDVTLKYASNSHPNEDFNVQQVGFVSDFCRSNTNPDGILRSTSVACIDYYGNPVYELDWTPFGNDSGYCAGTMGTPYNGMNVKLVDCGSTEGSLFIQDNSNAGPATNGCSNTSGNTSDTGPNFSDYISGATTQFSHPYVATVNAGTHRPDNQLQLWRRNVLTGGSIRDAQEWCFQDGPVS
jgi:hypothetical protein